MIRIGIVGVGFMGMIHYLAARKLQGAGRSRSVVATKPSSRAIGGRFRATLGRAARSWISPASRNIGNLTTCWPTRISTSSISAIRPTCMRRRPNRRSRPVSMFWWRKPSRSTTADADAMVAAARQAQRLLMVAHVLTFVPEFAFAARTTRSGEFGKLQGGHFRRIISRPDWSSAIGDATKTGGPAVDLHIHDTHFIGLVCGVPPRVFATGVQTGGAVSYLTTQYLYGPGGPVVSCSSGALAQKGPAVRAWL